MKRKAIIAARNKKATKKARVDVQQDEETFVVNARVSDLGIFEALPLEIEHSILVDMLCVATLSTNDIRAMVNAKLTCTRWKQMVDSACTEDFYWGLLYLKIFGDLDQRKGCISAKDKFLKTHSEFIAKFHSFNLDSFRIKSLYEARAFDPTMHFQEIEEDTPDPTEEIDWNYFTCTSIVAACRWMKKFGLDVLLYAYLKHIFDQCTKSFQRSIVKYVCLELPQLIKEFLLTFERREPDMMSSLAVECLQEIKRT